MHMNKGMDIIQAEKWMKKRRSHRGYSTKMDSELAAIYYQLELPDESAVLNAHFDSPSSNSTEERIEVEEMAMLEE